MRGLSLFLCLFLLTVYFDTKAQSKAAEKAAGRKFRDPADVVNQFHLQVEDSLQKVNYIQAPCETCEVRFAGQSTKAPKTCPEQYDDMFAKDVINIRVAFGYMDYNDEVDDAFAKQSMIERLHGECYPGQSACGFSRSKKDPELFFKTVQYPDPGGKIDPRTGHVLLLPKRVELRLKSSSVTESERLNRSTTLDCYGRPEPADALAWKSCAETQYEKSIEAENFWLDGMAKSDLLFYVGHARNGGGPSFNPPMLNDQKRTDLRWYNTERRSEALMLDVLKNSRTKPSLVGVFACYSESHFGPRLRAASPGTKFVLAGNNEFEAMAGQALMSIDAALGFRCKDDFGRAVNTLRTPDPKNRRDGPIVLSGPFGD